jgi:septal ring factor EnvC (AmiA/AmiB activator)
MKPALILFAGACLVLVGCGRPRADILSDIAFQEERLRRLESELVAYDTRLASVTAMANDVQVKANPAPNIQQRNDEAKRLKQAADDVQPDRIVFVEEIARTKQKIADLRKELK